MGAEPARIVAAPRSELGGAAPKREAAESQPLPISRPPRDDRPSGGFGDRDRGGDRSRGGPAAPGGAGGDRGDRGPRRDDRGPVAR